MVSGRFTTVAATLLALLLMTLAAGCAAPKPPDTAPSIRGAITSVSSNERGFGVILIEEPSPQGFAFDKASLTITEDTRILLQVDNGYRTRDFGALMEGVFVEAWVTGPVAESYPIQAAADTVLILP